ncbi:MAG: hypothetical protein JNL30_13070, partial [Rubrivivax sp.]|nr:hypothetical protein [Rubrivivax sp.]
PDGQLVLHSLNALGQPRAVGSGVASAVTFHPNGQLNGYTAGNGVPVQCRRRSNFDHPCRLNIDQGWKAAA